MRNFLISSISVEAQQHMLEQSVLDFPLETGGILVGSRDRNHLHIAYATAAGPLAEHSRVHFRRDGNYTQEVLDTLVGASGGRYDYIGEWHSHPFPQGPSPRDIRAMRWIADNPVYDCPSPVLALCVKEASEWNIRVFCLLARTLGEVHYVAAKALHPTEIEQPSMPE